MISLARAALVGGAPVPVTPPPTMPVTISVASGALLLRAFASGCTALTGVEAVSNAVPMFREPAVKRATMTLTLIIVILAGLLIGIALVVRAYHIAATPPGQDGYQSVLSQMVAAVMGQGWFYKVTMASVLCVLALSANTSFAGFPRVCRVLALDDFLPAEFAHRGRRLVYTSGVLVLTVLAAALLIAFGGITDRLIPLFAIGALLAFTFSQSGMVAHWWRQRGPGWRHSLVINAIGAVATSATLIIVAVSKFREGAWLTVLVVPGLMLLFRWIRAYHIRVERKIAAEGPLQLERSGEPLIVVPMKRLDRVARKALRVAMSLSGEIRVVQILAEELKTEDLTKQWPELVEAPARAAGLRPPRLVIVPSAYREFFEPLLQYIKRAAREEQGRRIAIMIPELVERKWYHFILRHRVTLLKGLLLLRGGPDVLVLTAPWYLRDAT